MENFPRGQNQSCHIKGTSTYMIPNKLEQISPVKVSMAVGKLNQVIPILIVFYICILSTDECMLAIENAILLHQKRVN